MEKIRMKCGRVVLIDKEFLPLMMEKTWFVSNGYVISREHVCRVNGKKKTKTHWLHRIINDTPDKYETDHINGNTLDNRRSNLRNATRSLRRLTAA